MPRSDKSRGELSKDARFVMLVRTQEETATENRLEELLPAFDSVELATIEEVDDEEERRVELDGLPEHLTENLAEMRAAMRGVRVEDLSASSSDPRLSDLVRVRHEGREWTEQGEFEKGGGGGVAALASTTVPTQRGRVPFAPPSARKSFGRQFCFDRSSLRMPSLTHLFDPDSLKTWFEALSLDGTSMMVGAVRFSVWILVDHLRACTNEFCSSSSLSSFYRSCLRPESYFRSCRSCS